MIRPMTDEERQRAKEKAMANKEQRDEDRAMSDDLVKQSLAELHDIVRCRCHPAYTGRGMHDPDCECDSVEAVKAVADRIEELSNCVAVLEAKLAKAVEAMQFWSEAVEPDIDKAIALMDATLAELSGDSQKLNKVERTER